MSDIALVSVLVVFGIIYFILGIFVLFGIDYMIKLLVKIETHLENEEDG